jgi:hypothetical protein
MIKNWNNFCALAALFLTFSLKINAQCPDSAEKISRSATVTLPFLQSISMTQTIFSRKEKTVLINWGSPFSHWGIMCIGEYQLEKKTGVPFRFRLGSLDYVNRLEGKK